MSGELLAVDDTGYLVLDTQPFPNSVQAVRHSALFAGEVFRLTAPTLLPHPDRVTIVSKRNDTLWVRTVDRDLVVPVGAVTKVETYKNKPPGGFTEWPGGPRIVYVRLAEVQHLEATGTGAGPIVGKPDAAVLARLRLASRYPQGITPPSLAALLEAYGQSALERPVSAESTAS